MDKDSKKLQIAFGEAANQLTDYIKLGIDRKDIVHAKVCAATVGAYVRLKAVENNESIIRLDVAKTMANNTDELKAQVRKSLPEYAEV